MLNDQQRERVAAAIGRRQIRLDDVRAELRQKSHEYETAWLSLINEVGPGDLRFQERQLSDLCVVLQREIDLLKRCLNGELPVDTHPDDESRIICGALSDSDCVDSPYRAKEKLELCQEVVRLLGG